MRALDEYLLTPRLKLLPVTPYIAAAARESVASLAEAIDAEVPPDWSSSSQALVARSAHPAWGAYPPPVRAIVVHRNANVVVGDVRFEPSLQEPDEVEIGYEVVSSFRRQGFATEATGAVIDWLFREGGAAEIVAGCDMHNVPSVRTLRKLGFWLDSSQGKAFWWVLTPELRREALVNFFG